MFVCCAGSQINMQCLCYRDRYKWIYIFVKCTTLHLEDGKTHNVNEWHISYSCDLKKRATFLNVACPDETEIILSKAPIDCCSNWGSLITPLLQGIVSATTIWVTEVVDCMMRFNFLYMEFLSFSGSMYVPSTSLFASLDCGLQKTYKYMWNCFVYKSLYNNNNTLPQRWS